MKKAVKIIITVGICVTIIIGVLSLFVHFSLSKIEKNQIIEENAEQIAKEALEVISGVKSHSKEDENITSESEEVYSEAEAISLIKKQYPQLQDFPNDKLPSKIILVEKVIDGWYVIFETLGSGIPILEAECFFVDNSNTVIQIGHYKHTGGMETNISFKTCS